MIVSTLVRIFAADDQLVHTEWHSLGMNLLVHVSITKQYILHLIILFDSVFTTRMMIIMIINDVKIVSLF